MNPQRIEEVKFLNRSINRMIKQEQWKRANVLIRKRNQLVNIAMEEPWNSFTREQAQHLCSHWHNGQWSALYQFANSGIYLVENHLRYLKELQECREPEYALHPGEISDADDKDLERCQGYFIEQGKINGIETTWEKHPIYGYMIPYLKEGNREVDCLHLLI